MRLAFLLVCGERLAFCPRWSQRVIACSVAIWVANVRLDRWRDEDWQAAEDALANAELPAKPAPPQVVRSAFVHG